MSNFRKKLYLPSLLMLLISQSALSQESSTNSQPVSIADLKSDADYRDLQDDPSRADLFEKIISARLQEDARTPVQPGQEPFALPQGFTFPVNARVDDGKKRENSIFGIDVSHYSDTAIDFPRLKTQEVSFVYIKATQGTGYKDGTFATFWNKAAAAGMLRGAYHFISSQSPGADQGASFVKFIDLHGGFLASDLPPVVDLEWDIKVKNGPDQWASKSPSQIVDTVLACLKAIEAASPKRPIIYTSGAWVNDRKIPASEFGRLNGYKIWIADYSKSHRAVEKPAVVHGFPNLLWQFAENATVQHGYDGGLDANIFYGSHQDFASAFGVIFP